MKRIKKLKGVKSRFYGISLSPSTDEITDKVNEIIGVLNKRYCCEEDKSKKSS